MVTEGKGTYKFHFVSSGEEVLEINLNDDHDREMLKCTHQKIKRIVNGSNSNQTLL